VSSYDVNQLSKSLAEGLVRHFGKKCNDVCVKKKTDAPMGYFMIDFTLFDYFVVICEYRQGLISFSIPFGTSLIHLKNVQAKADDLDMKKLLSVLEAEIVLRIPDKYLQAKGWVN